MGNLVSMLAHLGRGQEIDRRQGAPSRHRRGRRPRRDRRGERRGRLEDQPDGTLDLHAIDAAFRDPTDPHEPLSGLVTLENTHAHSMGRPLTPSYEREVAAIARRHGVPLHIDGARFWNAVVAQRDDGVTGRDLADPADSVTFCLSKALGCPVGSVVVGSRDFIARARRARKMVGGGMRQAGILAAAGLVALSDGPDGMIDRLADDHANARRLAEALAEHGRRSQSAGGVAQPAPGRLDPGRVATNFVLFKVDRDRAPSSTRSRRGAYWMVEYLARTGPRGDPPRRLRRRHRHRRSRRRERRWPTTASLREPVAPAEPIGATV